MFSPHTFIALNIEPNEKFSQAFHGAGHKCISRECFNWMRISKHLHTSISIYRQIYQGGPGASLEMNSYGADHRHRSCENTVSTSWFGFPEFVFCHTNICLPCDNSLYIWTKNSPEKERGKIGQAHKRTWLVISNLQPCFPPLCDWVTKFSEFANRFRNFT